MFLGPCYHFVDDFVFPLRRDNGQWNGVFGLVALFWAQHFHSFYDISCSHKKLCNCVKYDPEAIWFDKSLVLSKFFCFFSITNLYLNMRSRQFYLFYKDLRLIVLFVLLIVL